jgi:calpain-15
MIKSDTEHAGGHTVQGQELAAGGAMNLYLKPFDASFEEAIRTCVANREMYTDESFPPQKTSLIEAGVSPGTVPFGEIEWRRPHEIPELNDDEGELAIFADGVTPNDIRQGIISNCYFLSALSVLAEFPERVYRLFKTDEANAQGVWCVQLYKNGKHQEIVLDDYIPCKDGSPCFTRAQGNELWVLIVEKAWAKVHGSYERTAWGFPNLAMRDLTGAPGYSLPTAGDGLCEKLLEWDGRDYIMCASAQFDEAAPEEKQSMGIANQHAYGVIAAKRLTPPLVAEEVVLVQLRNPWGHFEWNGPWSDDSELWTDAIKESVGFSAADDGLFWMNLEDF